MVCTCQFPFLFFLFCNVYILQNRYGAILRLAYVTDYISNCVEDSHFLVASSVLTRPVSPVQWADISDRSYDCILSVVHTPWSQQHRSLQASVHTDNLCVFLCTESAWPVALRLTCGEYRSPVTVRTPRCWCPTVRRSWHIAEPCVCARSVCPAPSFGTLPLSCAARPPLRTSWRLPWWGASPRCRGQCLLILLPVEYCGDIMRTLISNCYSEYT